MYPHRSLVFSHSDLLTCLSHSPQCTRLLWCCPNFVTASCKWSLTCVDFPVEMRFYFLALWYGAEHVVLFVSFVYYVLYNGWSPQRSYRFNQGVGVWKDKKEDRCYIPLADNCTTRLFPTGERVLWCSKEACVLWFCARNLWRNPKTKETEQKVICSPNTCFF